ncbi:MULTISPECIES: hypothetical protein [Brevundimonas]|uniref:hypothetical protein n=1 Tax=Brevundimonas TaxID=41275 RepID=UPI0025C379AB|nr:MULTISPECIES: hypothetical protein [Brevundimonas]
MSQERVYVEEALAIAIERGEAKHASRAQITGGAVRVVAGVYDFDTGFFDGAIDEAVEKLAVGLSMEALHRSRMCEAFVAEVLKIQAGIREGWLTGLDPLGVVSLVIEQVNDGECAAVSGFSLAWYFDAVPGRELRPVEFEIDD